MHLGRVPATALIVLAALIPLWVIDLAPSSDAALPSPKAPSLDGLNRTVLREYLPPPIVPRPAIIEKMVSVQKGDTLMTLLVKAGIPRNDARNAIAALSQHYSPKSIRPGQNLNLNFQERDEADPLFLSLIFQPTIYEEISVHRVKDKFAATKAKRAIERRQIRAEGEITDNLYNSAIRAGIAPAMLMELIRIYSWDVDFQRGIRPGDEFKVMYEGLFDEDGNFARHGNILYADLILSGESTPLTRFTTDKGRIDYFDDHGKSARKALMRTPIDGARLSSGYGRRRHPILGYTKMHKGLDFAAARGTPIYAAGSGTIVYRARKGAYGKYIRIRHNSEYSTAYAHMKGFARTATPGSRVKQGQVIGYVGTTGRSTGPHLHYEVLRGGRQLNPRRLKLPSGEALKGKDLKKFQTTLAGVQLTYAALPKQAPKPTEVAKKAK